MLHNINIGIAVKLVLLCDKMYEMSLICRYNYLSKFDEIFFTLVDILENSMQ